MYRIGHGYDIHRFKSGNKLILGGVEIPFPLGMDAHSDGDVIIHASCDAILGALALGDIGKHFPDTASEFKSIDSRILLRKVIALMNDKKYKIANIDISVIAEQPKLSPHTQKMREILAQDMQINIDQINIKATTNEKCDAIGNKEAIAVHAVVLLQNFSKS